MPLKSYTHGKLIPAHAQWARDMAKSGLSVKVIAPLIGVSERSIRDVLAGRTFRNDTMDVVGGGAGVVRGEGSGGE